MEGYVATQPSTHAVALIVALHDCWATAPPRVASLNVTGVAINYRPFGPAVSSRFRFGETVVERFQPAIVIDKPAVP